MLEQAEAGTEDTEVVASTPEEKTEETAAEPTTSEVVEEAKEQEEYIPEAPAAGKDVISQVEQLLASKNIEDADKILEEIHADGSLSLTTQAKLIDSLGAEVASLVTNQLTQEVQARKDAGKKEASRIKEYATKVFGSKDPELTWSDMQKFAHSESSGFSRSDLDAMGNLLGQGGVAAEMVIDKIASAYRRSDQFTQEADLLQGNVQTKNTFKPLSKADYIDQKQKVIREYGEGSQQDVALDQRRIKSMQAGY